MKFTKEIKAAVIVVSGLAAFIWGVNFLKGNNLFSKQRVFYAIYDQLDGLQNGNPVVIKGFKVGQVGNIHFLEDGSGKLCVKITVDANVKIPKYSYARIGSSDLLGSKNLEIVFKNNVQMAVSGDTLDSENQASISDQFTRQIKPIKDKAESLLATSDSILTSIQYVFNKNTRDNLSSTFASIERTFRSLEHSSYALDTLLYTQQARLTNIFGNVESITYNLKNNNERISKIFHNLSSVSDSLVKSNFATTVRNANAMLDKMSGIVEKINKGKGSLGMLINNDSLYKNLNASSADLDKLILDIHENPGRYVTISLFGGKGSSKKSKEKATVSK
jgi:phospholipid/cholesterol/gamma-HCH transport system substrate-binding protein